MKRYFGALLALAVIAAPARAQDHGAHATAPPAATAPSVALRKFVEAARAGAEKYRDRNVAIATGFRRLGRDFPSMGEHWAHPAKVVAGKFDIADPGMLTYATIDGKPTLIGVVYAIPLQRGQHPPALPDGVNAWHEHNGTVDEETFLPEHGGEHSRELPGTRLAILHVWTGLHNPAGPFSAENWALPFARLGLVAPATISEAAARALSLAAGQVEFYANMLDGELPASRGILRASLDQTAERARSIVVARQSGGKLSVEQLEALEKLWKGFTSGIERSHSGGRDLFGSRGSR